jgi:LPS export ABC transporter protein LptC
MLKLHRLWGVVMLLALGACTREPPPVRLAPVMQGEEAPTFFFEGFRMVSTRAGETEWEFESQTAQIYEKKHAARARDIKVIYWQKGRVVSTLTACHGFLRTDSKDIRAEENVVMVSEEGTTLRTERLDWDQKAGLIKTDLPVTVERAQDILTGIGLEADRELKNIKILAEVKIKVRSVRDLGVPAGK